MGRKSKQQAQKFVGTVQTSTIKVFQFFFLPSITSITETLSFTVKRLREFFILIFFPSCHHLLRCDYRTFAA